MNSYLKPIGVRPKQDSTTIRKQMVQFVKTATDDKPGMSEHPYDESFELASAVADTKIAAFRIAAAEQGFSFVVEGAGESLPVPKLQQSLAGRARHWVDKASETQRSQSSKLSSTRGLVIGAALGVGLGLTAGLINPLLGLTTTLGISGFCLNLLDEQRMINKDSEARVNEDLSVSLRKANEYQVALALVPQWAEMKVR
jgi:hypothetical protein